MPIKSWYDITVRMTLSPMANGTKGKRLEDRKII